MTFDWLALYFGFIFIGNGLEPLFTALITDYVFRDGVKVGLRC